MRKFFLWAISSTLLFSCGSSEKPAETIATNAEQTVTQDQPVEFADAKYQVIGKSALDALVKGDVDAWVNTMSDNVKFYWNNGDSLVGKAAVGDYWKKRRTEVIDTLYYTSDIWLPVKVNKPQQPQQLAGTWLLSWYQSHATYKTGKSMTQWIHTDMHFDANDKIDEIIQYIDRSLINAATSK